MNVGRSIIPVLIAMGALSPTLAAQSKIPQTDSAQSQARRHAIGVGFVATLGANWQMEAAEVGYVRRPSHGLAAIGLAGRLGTFVDESAMLGANKGVVFGATLSARTQMKRLAQLGATGPGTR